MIETVLGFIGQILYPLFGIIFYLIDMLQAIFFAFAGINDVLYDGTTIGSGNTGDVNDNGLIFYLLNSTVVRNAMYSIVLLAVVLIIIFTVMAFLKNIYADKPKSWKEILGSAIKGIANFFIIPVMCLLGVWLGNILLVAINGATSATNTMNLSRQLFITSSYNANRVRSGDLYGDSISEEEATEIQAFCAQYGVSVDLPSDPNGDTNLEYYAGKIDEVYAMANGPDITFTYTSVSRYYDLMGINYILLAGGGIFILYILVNIAFMMIKRMIMILILFIISPAICAMYPLDDGSKVKDWKGSFIKQFLSAFSAVAAMNLFFCISPLIQNIGIPGLNDLMGLLPLLLTIAGLYVVKDLITLINSFIGGETAFDNSLAKSVRGRIDFKRKAQKVAKVAGGAFGAGIGRAQNAKARGKSGVGAFFAGAGGNLGKQFNDASKNWGLGLRGAVSSAYQEGRKGWDNDYKSFDDKAKERRQKLIDQASEGKNLKEKQAELSATDTDFKKADKLGISKEMQGAAAVTYMQSLAEREKKAKTDAERRAIQDERNRIRSLDGLGAEQIMTNIDKFSAITGKYSEIGNLEKQMEELATSTHGGAYEREIRMGNKYSEAEIKGASEADKERMLDVNRAIDKYNSLRSQKESAGEELIKAAQDLKDNGYGSFASSLDVDALTTAIKDGIANNNLSTTSTFTDLIKIQQETKEAIAKGANAQMKQEDSMKKVVANTNPKKQKKE